ncbi:hypothetical protein [Haladaptatus sp. DYF46]|uniref:hypothetical protein n=1 Tax=Haladaptatus sp. DYF46 TaxID=2886041 RepID=UPI001E2AE0EC|nr:hypothetical protein [Haladaptatus sp. DYF46]
MSGYAPTPLNPHDADTLITHLAPNDCVRITTTELPQTICTVKATNSPTRCGPHLVLTAPPITTTAQDDLQQATFHCVSQPNSAMTVFEYTHTTTDTTTRCIGTLTTIAHLPRLSTPAEDTAVPVEVPANE